MRRSRRSARRSASCFTVKANTWSSASICSRRLPRYCLRRFPAGSEDRKQCRMMAITYSSGSREARSLDKAAQECAAGQASGCAAQARSVGGAGAIELGYDGDFTVYAYDSETHIPVRARLSIDGGTLRADSMVAGRGRQGRLARRLQTRAERTGPSRRSSSPRRRWKRTGYETVTFPFPIEVPTVTVDVTPPATLKPGKNTITITAVDSATGKPVECASWPASRPRRHEPADHAHARARKEAPGDLGDVALRPLQRRCRSALIVLFQQLLDVALGHQLRRDARESSVP